MGAVLADGPITGSRHLSDLNLTPLHLNWTLPPGNVPTLQKEIAVASDKKVAARKKGNPMSTFLLVAALIGAGGMGRFLWKYQARLDQPAPAPAAAAVAAEPRPDQAAPAARPPVAQVTELLPATPSPAPKAVKPAKPVRGNIQIVGKNGTASSVAPPTREDLTAGGVADRVTPAYNPAPGAKIYKPDDPNASQPRSAAPRHGPLSWD
jgi:hypothetical protein